MSMAAGAEGEPATWGFVHRGKSGDLFGLSLKNALFGAATLTLYRFWARTAVRRRVWSRAWLMGDPLEYTGTGWELFRGFLISLPCFFLPAMFVFYIAPLTMEPALAGLLAFVFYLIAVPLIAAARYWMRRYQLTRTRWRGIRLGLDGSAVSFGIASAGWTLVETVTLGWYGPAARMKRAAILWENARFGDQPFEFTNDEYAPTKGLYGPFALGWFGTGLAYILAFFFVGLMIGLGYGMSEGEGGSPVPSFAITAAGIGVGALVFAFIFTLVWAPYNAAAMNRIASLIGIDGARFRLRAKTWSLFGVSFASLLIFLFSLTLLAPLAGMLHVRYVLNRLEMAGLPRFADIAQPVSEAPRSGESMADAFDLDLGVGMI